MSSGAEQRRIKVLILMTSSAGGAGLQAYQLCKDISHDEFEISAAFGPGYPLDEDFQALDCPVEFLSISRKISPLVNLRGFFQAVRLMKRERYDIVCTSCSIAGLLGRLAAALARIPVRVHIIQVYASRPFQFTPRQRVFRWIERRLDRFTTRYVAVSGAVKKYGVDTGIFAPEAAEVIFNAAELPPANAEGALAVRRELDLDPEAPVIGTLGRYEPQKGLSYFLRAAARIHRVHPEARFLLVGDGPLLDELTALARQLGISEAVRFTGWRRDVPEVLRAMDIFGLASLWETFGIVLAEAMLSGLPLVATRVDGIPEVVADGETGYLVPPEDDETLATRLIELLENPELAARMGRAGRERAAAKFSVENMVTAYERLFRKLVG